MVASCFECFTIFFFEKYRLLFLPAATKKGVLFLHMYVDISGNYVVIISKIMLGFMHGNNRLYGLFLFISVIAMLLCTLMIIVWFDT